MKILTLLFTYNTSFEDWESNGSVDRELAIYTKLSKYFDKVYFITYGEKDKKYQKRLPSNIILLPKKYPVPNSLYSLLIPFAYKRELKKSSWIKTNQIMGSWTAVLIKLFLIKKIAIRTGYTESLSLVSKNYLKKSLIWLIEFIAYKFSDTAIVTSKHQQDYLKKQYHLKNIHVIPNGIDTELFKPINTTKNDSIVTNLLFIGRLHKEKNVINLIKSLKGIKRIKLLVIGNGHLQKEVLELKNEYNINITLIDKVPNNTLPDVYTKADIYIQPSLYEGNPKTILEAMSCGLPVISTDVDGINNVITHKQNGYLCQINSNSIRTAILSLRNNTKLKEKIGGNARKYILENYNLDNILKKEIKLYKKYKS